jgi:hypothetical protein
MNKLIFSILIIFALQLSATIINIPADQPTIQEGIDVSADSDTVLVQPGTYVENIDYNGKNIIVASLFLTTQDITYISSTIIDGNQEGSVVAFSYSPTALPILDGFTIRNGQSYNGGGVCCIHTSSILRNLIVENNFASEGTWNQGGGIYIDDASVILQNVEIINNIATGGTWNLGGGIYCTNSELIMHNVLIAGNTVSNGSWRNGGGIHIGYSSVVDVYNTTITDNSAYYGGGIECGTSSDLMLCNCIIWDNSGGSINGSATVYYSDIQYGWEGNTNINENPLFAVTGDHPFMLQDLSPCINAGIPDTTGLNLPEFDLAGNSRIYGGRIDMGAYENQNVVSANNDLILSNSKLYQNYPNPFNPTTIIDFSIQNDSKLELSIFNIKGQKIKTLAQNEFVKGQHSIIWNGVDESNNNVSSGIYYYELKVNGTTEAVKKCLLLK